jgi:hypothetical protein
MTLAMTFAFTAAVLHPASLAAEDETTATTQKPQPKKTKKKKKGYDYEKSKYKSYKALTGSEEKTYKFDEEGNPVPPTAKKKAVYMKGKPRPPEEDVTGPDATEAKPVSAASVQQKAPVKKAAAPAAEVYACPMGDYEGPMTKDGRCPKCGMQLQKK